MLSRIKRANKRVRVIILGVFLLAGGLAYSLAFGYGLNNNSDGLVLDIDFSQANYNSSTRTFTDRSGNGNHGVSSSDVIFVADKDGKSSGAISLNGTSNYVNIPTSNSLNPGADMSFSAWVYWQGGSGDDNILTKENAYQFRVNNGYVNYAINPWAWRGGTSAPINTNTWNHVVVTHDGDGFQKIYINGIERFTTASGGGIASNSNVVTVGARYGGTASFFNGLVKDVTIYNRVLSIEEVKQMYKASMPKAQFSSLEKGLIGYWPLDADNFNASDNKVTDKSAYGNHGVALSASLSTGRNDEAGSAFDFGGINDGYSINIPNNNFAGLSDFSMSAWIYIKGAHLHYDGTIISSGNWNNTHWSFGIAQNNDSFKTRNPSASVAYSFNQNRWYHVVYKRQGTTLSFYVDGVLVSSVNSSSNIPLTSGYTNTKIGMDTYTGNHFNFNGKISEVRIYNRALSADEVGQLYSLSKPKIAAKSLNQGLVLDLPLTSKYTKGGSAGSEIMTDLSAYSHDGQNFGGVVSAEGTLLANTGNRVETNLAVPNSGGTISIWYKPTYSSTDVNRNSVLYSTGNSWVSNSFELALRGCCGNPYDNVLYMMASNNSYLSFEWDGPTWEANQWINLTIVYDSRDYIKPYVNGELQTSYMAVNSADFNFPAVFNIGARNAAGVSAKGTVSYLKVYNRPLSAAEIKTLYEKGRGDSGAILSGINN